MSSKLKKVFVGISGGVDSATSAAILKRDGYDVTGVFIKIWSPEWTRCSMQDDRRDAMRVCAALDIPFREIDCTEEYKKDVIDPMIESYKRGDVPNPDVLCNRYVKFGAFFEYAMKEGADFVATGHYAKIATSVQRQATSPELNTERYTLIAAADAAKDQTYFLWTLTQRELAKTLFPVGDLQKSEVRMLATKLGVPVAEKKDSQGLCFLGSYGVDEFLAKYIKSKQGNVLNENGEIIGTHEGVHFLTVGSRHGFNVTKHGTNAKPLYIISKNVEANSIIVSENKLNETGKRVVLTSVNWTLGEAPSANVLQARPYHRAVLLDVSFEILKNNEVAVIFIQSPPPLSSGQSIVLYKDGVCLGGGVITYSHVPNNYSKSRRYN